MLSNSHRRIRSGGLRLHWAAAALVAATAACSDGVSAPQTRPASLAASHLTAATGPALTPNGVKYRNAGASNATGRSGSATLEGRAVMDGHGVTRLEITTGHLDSSTPAPGEIVKAQLKIFSADGELSSVENHNHLTGGGEQTFLLPGLAPGSRIQVQANVRGIDGHRTDVVTLSAGVVHAARLEVELQLPGQAQVGQPVVITALVSEVGGDVGTRADCVLYVDGQAVDRAEEIWVDAGDQVTCAFSYTFASGGQHEVEVRVAGDASGASLGVIAGDGGGLDVVDPPPTLSQGYTASAETRLAFTSTTLDYTWWNPNGSHKEYAETNTATHRTQTLRVDGTMNRPLQFPLVAATLTMRSGGATWLDHDWAAVASIVTPEGQVCANRQVTEEGAMFWVCNGGLGATVGYSRFGGTVVYHSEGFGSVFDGPTATVNAYTWNNTYEEYDAGGAIRPLGQTVDFTIRITDAQGTFTFSPAITLSSFSTGPTVTPRTCSTESPYWLDGGTQTTCTSGTASESGVRGTTSG